MLTSLYNDRLKFDKEFIGLDKDPLRHSSLRERFNLKIWILKLIRYQGLFPSIGRACTLGQNGVILRIDLGANSARSVFDFHQNEDIHFCSSSSVSIS